MSSARAAINAALEAARAASRMGSGGGMKRPPAASEPAAAPPAPPSAPGAGPAAGAAPASVGAAQPARPAPSAPWEQAAPNANARMQAPAGAPAPAHVGRAGQPSAMQADPVNQSNQGEQALADDEPPSWVTEFSDDAAVAMDTPTPAVAPAPVAAPAGRAPAQAPHPYVITPVDAIGWDGNWPALAAALPLRGVAQQLALQTELIACEADGAAATFRLRVPVDTLRASGNSEKLCAALQERFPAIRVNVDTEIGPVWYTASAEAKARREQLQREAEITVAADPFVQGMERTFDAFVVPGSVRPTAT
jgi:DNA polymerase-3 subunit gamma/tau